MIEQVGRCWFCVNTKPHKEHLAEFNLENQGFETFLPEVRTSVRHAGKGRVRRVPLFKGYIFVRFDPVKDNWRSVNGTYGVKSLVMQGSTPLPVPFRIVDELQVRCGVQQCMQFNSAPYTGDYGRAIDAWMKRIEQLDDQGRVCALIDILNSSQLTKLEVPAQ